MCEYFDNTQWGKAWRKSLKRGGHGDDPKTVKGPWHHRKHWKDTVWRFVFFSSLTRCNLHIHTYRHNVCSIDEKICTNNSQQKICIYIDFSKTIFLKGCSFWLLCRCFNHWIWMLLLLVGRVQGIFWCNHFGHLIVTEDHQKHGNTHQSLGEFDWKEINSFPIHFSPWCDLQHMGIIRTYACRLFATISILIISLL